MDKIAPTVNFVADVLKKDASCNLSSGQQCEMRAVNFIIDPLLFQRFAVQSVPAFVYVKGLSVSDPSTSEGFSSNIEAPGTFLKMSGDAGFGYVLAGFARETGSPKLEEAAKKLK